MLAVHVFGTGPDYASGREDHLDDEQALKAGGVLLSSNGPHHAHLNEDVRFSLGLFPVHRDASTRQEEH